MKFPALVAVSVHLCHLRPQKLIDNYILVTDVGWRHLRDNWKKKKRKKLVFIRLFIDILTLFYSLISVSAPEIAHRSVNRTRNQKSMFISFLTQTDLLPNLTKLLCDLKLTHLQLKTEGLFSFFFGWMFCVRCVSRAVLTLGLEVVQRTLQTLFLAF